MGAWKYLIDAPAHVSLVFFPRNNNFHLLKGSSFLMKTNTKYTTGTRIKYLEKRPNLWLFIYIYSNKSDKLIAGF